MGSEKDTKSSYYVVITIEVITICIYILCNIF